MLTTVAPFYIIVLVSSEKSTAVNNKAVALFRNVDHALVSENKGMVRKPGPMVRY